MLRWILWGGLFMFAACSREKKQALPAPASIIAQWSAPELEFKGLDLSILSADEKGEWKFLLGGMEKIFEDMCVEYFDDRPGNKDSYKMTLQLPNEAEPHTEFGEYELLAAGKRLVMYTPDGKKLNVELTRLDQSKQQWRLQMRDLLELSGDLYELPENMPDVVLYMTFQRRDSLTLKE